MKRNTEKRGEMSLKVAHRYCVEQVRGANDPCCGGSGAKMYLKK